MRKQDKDEVDHIVRNYILVIKHYGKTMEGLCKSLIQRCEETEKELTKIKKDKENNNND